MNESSMGPRPGRRETQTAENAGGGKLFSRFKWIGLVPVFFFWRLVPERGCTIFGPALSGLRLLIGPPAFWCGPPGAEEIRRTREFTLIRYGIPMVGVPRLRGPPCLTLKTLAALVARCAGCRGGGRGPRRVEAKRQSRGANSLRKKWQLALKNIGADALILLAVGVVSTKSLCETRIIFSSPARKPKKKNFHAESFLGLFLRLPNHLEKLRSPCSAISGLHAEIS